MPPVLAACAGAGCVCSTGVVGHGGEVGVSRGQEGKSVPCTGQAQHMFVGLT